MTCDIREPPNTLPNTNDLFLWIRWSHWTQTWECLIVGNGWHVIHLIRKMNEYAIWHSPIQLIHVKHLRSKRNNKTIIKLGCQLLQHNLSTFINESGPLATCLTLGFGTPSVTMETIIFYHTLQGRCKQLLMNLTNLSAVRAWKSMPCEMLS